MSRPLQSSLLYAAGAIVIFEICATLASFAPLGNVGRQVLLKALLIAASFAAMAMWRPAGADWGMRWVVNVRWTRVIAPALAMGAAASIMVLAGGGKGLQAALGQMHFWQVILVVWLWSSISEEIFTRGWLQGALHQWGDMKVGPFSLPALVSAAVFGAMHVSLFWKGADTPTATTVVVLATALGLWAGLLRERYSSIAPPLAAHIGFNVGGAIGGVLFVVTYRIATGHLPPQIGTP
jgi:membrane protease YdiL (CAAX protease family)